VPRKMSGRKSRLTELKWESREKRTGIRSNPKHYVDNLAMATSLAASTRSAVCPGQVEPQLDSEPVTLPVTT
jgi:hypothetical protein